MVEGFEGELKDPRHESIQLRTRSHCMHLVIDGAAHFFEILPLEHSAYITNALLTTCLSVLRAMGKVLSIVMATQHQDEATQHQEGATQHQEEATQHQQDMCAVFWFRAVFCSFHSWKIFLESPPKVA